MADQTMPGEAGPSDAARDCSTRTGPAAVIDIHQLIADHHQPLYRYAFRLTGSAADAEDLTQQTFLVAQQKLHQVRQPDRVEGWLFTVLRSCYLKLRRKRTPAAASNLDLGMDHVPADVPDDSLDQEELQNAINDLADDFKLVVLMFYFEDCSYKEIAARLQIPMGTVMSRLARAKRHLRARLSGHAAEDAADTHAREAVQKEAAQGPTPRQ